MIPPLRVRNVSNGFVQAVRPDASVEERIRSGELEVAADQTIGLRDEQGNAYDVEGTGLANALASGLRLETADERAQLDAQRYAEEHPIESGATALGANLVNELAFGAGDAVAQRALDREGRARLEAAREAHPILGGIGTAAGILAPALLTGGGSLAVEGESLAARGALRGLASLTPSGLAARGGSAVERLILGSAGESAAVGRHVLSRVGGAVADGAISGAAQAIADANIEGRPIEAEQILSDTLFGAALGLGGGAVIEGLGATARGLTRLGRGAVDGGERLASYAERLTSRGLGEAEQRVITLPGGIEVTTNARNRGALSRLASRLSGAAEDDVALIVAAPQRAFDEAGFARAARETSDTLSSVASRVDDAAASLADVTARRGALDAALETADHATARAATRATLETAQGRLREAVAAFDGRGGSGSALRSLASEVERSLSRVGEDASAAVAHTELDRIVDAIDSAARRAKDDGGRALLSELRTSVGTVARDPAIFGGAGARFGELDGLAQRWRDARQALALDSAALAEAATTRGGGEALERLGHSLDAADDVLARAESLGADVAPARESLSQARQRLGDTLSWGEVRGAAERGLGAEAKGGAVRQLLTSLVGHQASKVAGAAIGTVLGGPVGGVAGAAIGAGIDAGTHSISTLRRIAHLGDAIRGYGGRIGAGVERLERAIKGARQLGPNLHAASAVRTTSHVVAALRGEPDERRREYRHVSDEVRALASDPDALGQRLSTTIGPVGDASPQLADAMHITAVRGVQYLAANLPAVDTPTLFPGADDLEPSQWEIDGFLRRYEAVEDPLSILDRAADGSLHLEHTEAVQTVYPEIYADMQARIAELLGQQEKRPPYAVRMQLGILMGVPADRSLRPEMISALQSQYAQTTGQYEAIHSTGSQARIGSTLSENALSGTDEIARRL